MTETTPTFADLLEAYPRIAAIERAKCERPGETTVANVLAGVRAVLRGVGVEPSACRITDLTRRRIDGYLAEASAHGLSAISSWTYVHALRALVARWTRSYYEDLGWRVGPFDLPVCRRRPVRYLRPDRQVLLRLRAWYASLASRPDVREWMAATLMLEFAMRNGDVRRLRWCDFLEDAAGVRLRYMPHKTRLSSGRLVVWPVHAAIWREFAARRPRAQAMAAASRSRGRPRSPVADDLVVPRAGEVFAHLNRDLRARRLFVAVKGCYELRKVCVDHVYQRFGAEAASSISGDDIRTVTRYYADPSAVSVANVRVVDLL